MGQQPIDVRGWLGCCPGEARSWLKWMRRGAVLAGVVVAEERSWRRWGAAAVARSGRGAEAGAREVAQRRGFREAGQWRGVPAGRGAAGLSGR